MKLLLTTVFVLALGLAQAQNPWAKYGYEPKAPLTLSKGKYQEFFTNDTIVHIGTAVSRLCNYANEITGKTKVE